MSFLVDPIEQAKAELLRFLLELKDLSLVELTMRLGESDPLIRRLFVFSELQGERARQDKQWGGPHHDDTLSKHDWRALIDDHLVRGWVGTDPSQPTDPGEWRRRLVVVAALAVAAIEAHDRQAQQSEAR